MELTNITDIDNIILDYKYRFEHFERLQNVLEELKVYHLTNYDLYMGEEDYRHYSEWIHEYESDFN